MTGALIPKPLNTVIPIEKIQFYPSENKKKYILINERLSKNNHIRFLLMAIYYYVPVCIFWKIKSLGLPLPLGILHLRILKSYPANKHNGSSQQKVKKYPYLVGFLISKHFELQNLTEMYSLNSF